MSKQKLTNSHKTCGILKLNYFSSSIHYLTTVTVLITVQQCMHDSPLQATEMMFIQLSFLKPHCFTWFSLPVQLRCQSFFFKETVVQLYKALPQLRLSHNFSDISSFHWDAQTCSLSMSTSPVQLFESIMFGSLPGEEWSQTIRYLCTVS